MKIWRLISGILSMVSFLIITFQSCATGVVNVLEDNNHDTSDVAGFFCCFGLAGGWYSSYNFMEKCK